MTAEAFPLQWPEGWPRAARRARSRFKVAGVGRVRFGILRSLRLVGVHDYQVVLSTNIPLKIDGEPYAKYRQPEDPGAAVYWFDPVANESRCMACNPHEMQRLNQAMAAAEKELS